MKKGSAIDRDKAREEFEQFLFEMDDVLEDTVAVARERGYELDFSLESLDALEQLLLRLRGEGVPQELLRTRGARYLGEVFRKSIGGKWVIYLDNPKNLYYGLPVLLGYSDLNIEFCPSVVVNNFLLRERHGLLRSALEADREFARK